VGALPRLGLFLATLAVVFGGSFAVGAALDTDDDPPPEPAEPTATLAPATSSDPADHGAHGGSAPASTTQP
jgi:hypothetical protein